MGKKSAIWLIVIIVLISFFSYVGLKGMPLWNAKEIIPLGEAVNLGLDLQGGLRVVYEAQIDPDNEDAENDITKAKEIIRERLDRKGQNEATISEQGADRIVVEIPGVEDPNELAEFLAEPAVLEFVSPEGDVIVEGKDIKSASAGYITGNNPVVNFEMYPEGADAFAEATIKYENQVISINLDGEPISQPKVSTPILSGEGYIEGMGSIEEAMDLAIKIESGALPVELKQVQTSSVGATLGANALDRAIMAGFIGILAILLFMLIYYKLPGLVADLAIIVFLLLDVIILVSAKVTLTLPGIAGIILTVGMAVDANVIIFERMREELRLGKSLRSAVDSGFSKAFKAILDANITTLIAGVVLLFLGTGPIQGFAKTLIIGIVISMLTAIIFTKHVLRLMIDLNVKNKKLYSPGFGRKEQNNEH